MIIKTITCHDCYNFGASLQAFALQHYLERLGHDVEIIDYKPWYLSGHYKLWNAGNPRFNKPLVWQLYNLAKLPSRITAIPRKKAFDKFTSSYLHLTHRYTSYEVLKSTPPEADAYIAGSDQIWNTFFQNGRDSAFYLHFGKQDAKRISYAASFATPEIAPEYFEFVSKELKNFDAVSIREKSSLKLLKSLGVHSGVAVCDPVFLIRKEEWEALTNSLVSPSKKYILVYLTDKSNKVKNIAHEIRKTTGWKIFSVGCYVDWADKNFTTADPVKFVSLINESQYVISNSFHATAFAIILNKNFCVVPRTESINERMKSLLNDYGLYGRLTDKYSSSLLKELDFCSINKTAEIIVSHSKQWLHQALEK